MKAATDHTDASGLLPAYLDGKLKLAAIAEVLLTMAQERKDQERAHTLQRLLADLAEDAFRLAVLGKYNRGKSSLMNALLGHDWLPTGILPLTSVITTVRYGTNPRVLIRTEGSSIPREIAISDLPLYVTEQHNPGNRQHIAVAEIQVPAELLRNGVLFVDTPGLGSGIAANTETTRQFLPEADAAIVVLSFESPFDEADANLLNELSRLERKLFVALNKSDLVSPDQQHHVTAFVGERLADQLSQAPSIFALSARDGLKARMEGNEAGLEDSGLKAFEQQLIDFLTEHKARLFLNRVLQRTRELIEQEELEYSVAGRIASSDAGADQLVTVRDRGQSLLARIDQTFSVFLQELPPLFVDLLDDDIRSWWIERKSEIVASDWDTPNAGDMRLDEWLSQRIVAAATQLRGWEEDACDDLRAMYLDLQRSGDDLLGKRTDLHGEHPDLSQNLMESNIPVGKVPPFTWRPPEWLPAIPSVWLRNNASRRVEKELDTALEAYSTSTNSILDQACRHWLEQSREQAQDAVRTYVARLESLVARPVDKTVEAATVLSHLRRRLNEIDVTVSGNAANFVSPLGSDAAVEPKAPCFVCKKVSDAAFDFLRQFQYRVTKDPLFREGISDSGGLCPFHTWAYESIGSPQGIAQGYASVLQAVAHQLERAAMNRTLRELARGMIELLPGTRDCRICQVASAAESIAINEYSGLIASKENGHLCLVHLRDLVTREKDADRARSWMRKEAAELRRISQDMQQFSLKHSALRHYLSTEGERNAVVRGLMMLAGARQLSFVRQIQDLL